MSPAGASWRGSDVCQMNMWTSWQVFAQSFITAKALGHKTQFLFSFGLLFGPQTSCISEAAGPLLEKLASSAPDPSEKHTRAPSCCWVWPFSAHHFFCGWFPNRWHKDDIRWIHEWTNEWTNEWMNKWPNCWLSNKPMLGDGMCFRFQLNATVHLFLSLILPPKQS